MKKRRVSLFKKPTYTILILILVELLIIFAFVLCLKNVTGPISIDETKQIDIVVDDIYYFGTHRNTSIIVVANSIKYLFTESATFKDYSTSELYRAISKDDFLTLMYYESDNIIFGKRNIVVGARTETEIYRSLDEYNRGTKDSDIITIVLFSVLELIFLGVAFVNIWLKRGARGRFCCPLRKKRNRS